MQTISRTEAVLKIREHYAPVVKAAKKRKIEIGLPNFMTMRNYELESMLEKYFGGEWMISELCPFDGKYCQFGETIE